MPGGENKSVEEVFRQYGNMLYRISLVMLKNEQDAEDAVQDTLIKYIEYRKGFREEEHRKAWLIRVTVNLCKNRLLFYRRHPKIRLEELADACRNSEDCELLEYLMELPGVCREVMLLHYVEGYSVRETAEILRITEAAVKKRLQRGREKLRGWIGQEER